jgi:uncharacterized protein
MGDHAIGRIGWVDLTVDDATGVRDFYSAVVGWSTGEVSMGDYSDYTLHPGPGGEPVAGICHARGVNAAIPPQWLVYITVADVEASAAICREKGGTLLVEPRALGEGRFCVIRDPAGAVCALYSTP